MLKVPSPFGNQPSNAPVILCPEVCGGSSGNCAQTHATLASPSAQTQPCALISRNLPKNALLLRPPLNPAAVRLMLRGPRLVVVLGDVSDIHPRVRHLIHRAISVPDPLLR